MASLTEAFNSLIWSGASTNAAQHLPVAGSIFIPFPVIGPASIGPAFVHTQTPAPAPSQSVNSLVHNLVHDSATQTRARKHGLQISHVAWEDTGRTKGSCWGPNISDMTLCVQRAGDSNASRASCASCASCYGDSMENMPIIRKPNFADDTSDQNMADFTVNVGNECGSGVHAIPLREYLSDITKYSDIKVTGSLVSDRDDKVLTSAQSCVLPLKDGKVEFGVKLYNYQSQSQPAVLVVVASAQGTSAHVALGKSETLGFNKGGKLAQFVAERLRDDRARRGVALDGAMTQEEKLRNAVLIFQIPLVYSAPRMLYYTESYNNEMSFCYDGEESLGCGGSASPYVAYACAPATLACGVAAGGMSSNKVGGKSKQSKQSMSRCSERSASRGMDHAMLSTSEGRGDFPSLAKWTVQRDVRMPIRCTIQYYHVTDANTVDDADMETIAAEVVRHGPIGSLVTDRSSRPTEHTVPTPTVVLLPVAYLSRAPAVSLFKAL